MLAWVLFLATGTSAGPAISEPGEFLVTLLDGITVAGLFFVVASGFTLIFGLMRTVNMAHGSLFAMAAYIGITVQQTMVGKTRNIEAADVSMAAWFVPLLVGALVAALIGITIQQVLLRWNEGQELRQALITLAVAVILADQMLAWFGGLATPDGVARCGDPFHRDRSASGMPHLASSCSGWRSWSVWGLWLWLGRTRMGMVIRAGVDDRDMVRALGINIMAVFAVTFFVGAFLAGVGGIMGASFAGVAPGC